MIKTAIYKKIKNTFGDTSHQEYQEFNNIRSSHDLEKFREEALKKLIIHSYHNVPHYHQIMKEIGLTDGKKVDLTKFGALPILTKEGIKTDEENLISKDYHERKWLYNYSGGSTGKPIRVIQDYSYTKHSIASNYYYYRNLLNIDEPYAKKILLWGSPTDFSKTSGLKSKILDWFTNKVFLNSYRMTPDDMDGYIKTINSYQPDLIRGYSGSLYELAKHAKNRNMDLYSPPVLVGSAESLNTQMRNLIEEVFKTKIHDFYGSREINNLAGECEEGMMHILPSNIIEILDDNNNPVSPGQTGKVIVTNLFNYSMPLIRYQIGDMATLGPLECKCGNPLPTLEKIDGRLFESFVLEDGTIISGEFFVQLIGVYCNKGFIDQFQVIQRDYDDLKVLVVSESLNKSEIEDINEKIRIFMGENCKIQWEFVSEIPPISTGKFLYTKSLLLD
jgi:phenylacetate-CoA ligase